VSDKGLKLRAYLATDEDAAIELWRRTWQQHYPRIDFTARVAWWRERWRNELLPAATITVAEREGALIGFVTVDPKTRYLDQIVVAPEAWGSEVAAALIAEARRLSPSGLELKVNADNARAIRFYEKHGFAITGQDVNPGSGAPIYAMSWREAR
jgi:putative acetyltransferase